MGNYSSVIMDEFYDFMGNSLKPSSKDEYCKDVDRVCDEVGTTPSALVGDLKQIDDLVGEFSKGGA